MPAGPGPGPGPGQHNFNCFHCEYIDILFSHFNFLLLSLFLSRAAAWPGLELARLFEPRPCAVVAGRKAVCKMDIEGEKKKIQSLGY